jgi:2'-5' RNA ligase
MQQRHAMIYVLAYPRFEPRVARNIAAFRSAHEPERAILVDPHITLVFGVRIAEPGAFAAFCQRAASRAREIPVEFSGSEIGYDPFEKTHKLFLVSSVGTDDLLALHERLYDGPHRRTLHPGISFKPHMTVASNRDQSIIERLDVMEIGSFPIAGRICALEVVELADNKLHLLQSIPLQRQKRPRSDRNAPPE